MKQQNLLIFAVLVALIFVLAAFRNELGVVVMAIITVLWFLYTLFSENKSGVDFRKALR